jgi:hypothetical protein
MFGIQTDIANNHDSDVPLVAHIARVSALHVGQFRRLAARSDFYLHTYLYT